MVASRTHDSAIDASGDDGRGTAAYLSLRHGGSLLCLLVLTTLAYAASLRGEYVYEDMRDAGRYETSVVWPGWSDALARSLRPTGGTMFVQAAVAYLTDTSPHAQRAVSLMWHLGNGVLLWLLARRVLTPPAALVAAGIFLLHPLQTESVAYVAGRSELLVGTAVLVALLAAERGWWVLAGVLAISAVLGKHAGVMALALVPLWASWRRLPTWTPHVRNVWWMACGIVAWVGLDFLRERALFLARPDQIAASLAAWARLLALWVVPVGQTIDHDWTAIAPIVSLMALLGWTAALIWAVWQRQRWMSLAVLWSLVVVLPRLVVQIGEGPHEHHIYAVTIALSLATGGLWERA